MSVGLVIRPEGWEVLQRRLAKLSNADLDELLESIGGEVENQTRRRIGSERTSADGKAWPAWSAKYRKTRKGGHKLLQSEGHLLDSIQYDVGVHGVSVGSALVYAGVHQDGFKGPQKVSAHRRKGRPVRAHTRMMDIPARPYLGISAANMRDITSVIEDFFDAVLEGRK